MGNTELAIPIIYLLGEYSPAYGCLLCENKVYTLLSKNVNCHNLRAFRVKKIPLKLYPCKVCDKLHVCGRGYPERYTQTEDNYFF